MFANEFAVEEFHQWILVMGVRVDVTESMARIVCTDDGVHGAGERRAQSLLLWHGAFVQPSIQHRDTCKIKLDGERWFAGDVSACGVPNFPRGRTPTSRRKQAAVEVLATRFFLDSLPQALRTKISFLV